MIVVLTEEHRQIGEEERAKNCDDTSILSNITGLHGKISCTTQMHLHVNRSSKIIRTAVSGRETESPLVRYPHAAHAVPS